MSVQVLQVSDAEYFADAFGEVPSLSQSLAHTLLTLSPAHAYIEHPRLGKPKDLVQEPDTRAVMLGNVMHKLILGEGSKIEIVEAEDWRTKDARAFRDAATAAGHIPILNADYCAALEAAEFIGQKLRALGVDLVGRSEVKYSWDEKGEHGSVKCRGMMDHVIENSGVIYDLKKIRSAHPRICAKHMVEYGYDIQWAAYTSALAKLRPELAGRIEMYFLFVEFEPPYAVLMAQPDGMMRELGEMRWSRAVALWERCLTNNHWPEYSDRVVQLSPPTWILNEEIGNVG